MQLSKSVDEKINQLGARSRDAHKTLEFLYSQPIIDAQRLSKVIGKNPQSAYKLIRILEDLEIITEITGAQRNRMYLFKDYLTRIIHQGYKLSFFLRVWFYILYNRLIFLS